MTIRAMTKRRARHFDCTGIVAGQADLLLLLCLSGGDVFGLRALGAIGYFHGYSLSLLKGLVTFCLDCAVMNENVFSTLLGNKPIALGIVKPLYRACYCFRHNFTL